MSYSYSFDRTYDKWSTLADTFDVMLDELNDTNDVSDVFVSVDSFDVDEVL
jgi:hypothetical protein